MDAEMQGTAESPSHGPRPRSAPRPVLIAIPFYKNEHLVADVLGSLIRCAEDVRRIGGEVVCYDDSPGYGPLAATLGQILPEAMAAFPCRLDRNPVNLGFVKTMNRAIKEAVDRRLDLLLLNSDTMVEPGALTEMARVSRLDPMIGFVNPRSNNATIATLPLAERFPDTAPTREAYRALAALLPEFSYIPTAVGFCMLIRWEILAAFGGFDEIYGAGYNEENDLVMRAARCGYRAVLANHAFVWHEGEQSFGTADLSRDHWEPTNRAILDRRYPEYGSYTGAHYNAPETIAERLLAALVPNAAGRLDVAFDFSSFVAAHNGTFQAGRQLLAAAQAVWGDLFDIHVLLLAGSLRIFRLWRVRRKAARSAWAGDLCRRLPVGQPYDWNSLQRLAMKGAVTGIYMLDTISIDCPQLTSPRLFNLWQFALVKSDMVAALSRMTLEQLRSRFLIPGHVVVSTVLLSLDIEDYRISGADRPAPGAGTLLVLGNHYQHKHLAPTANALAAAFPGRSVIALGEEKPRGREESRPLRAAASEPSREFDRRRGRQSRRSRARRLLCRCRRHHLSEPLRGLRHSGAACARGAPADLRARNAGLRRTLGGPRPESEHPFLRDDGRVERSAAHHPRLDRRGTVAGRERCRAGDAPDPRGARYRAAPNRLPPYRRANPGRSDHQRRRRVSPADQGRTGPAAFAGAARRAASARRQGVRQKGLRRGAGPRRRSRRLGALRRTRRERRAGRQDRSPPHPEQQPRRAQARHAYSGPPGLGAVLSAPAPPSGATVGQRAPTHGPGSAPA
ncbi:MAG: glycosyltransferase [Aliidongia sp.]